VTYYNRRGRPVTDEEFDVLDSDPHYRQLAAHKVSSLTQPEQVAWVSTIWRGRDDVEVAGLPDRIFETEVFSETVMDIDGWQQWHETEQRALDCHHAAVAWVCGVIENPTVEDVRPQDTVAQRTDEVIAAIDTALGCQQCGNDLEGSPSNDFCREVCQQDWHRARVGVSPILDGTGHLRFSDLVRHEPGLRRTDYASWEDWVVRVEQDLNRRLLASCYFTFDTQEL